MLSNKFYVRVFTSTHFWGRFIKELKKIKGKPISKHFSEENWAEEMVSIVNEAGDTHNIISCSKNIEENRTKYSKFS